MEGALVKAIGIATNSNKPYLYRNLFCTHPLGGLQPSGNQYRAQCY